VVNGKSLKPDDCHDEPEFMTPFKTLALVALLALLGIGAGIAVMTILLSGPESRKLDIVPISIEGLRLNVPQGFLRGGAVPPSGASERADLVIRFPDMTAAGIPPSKPADAADPRLLLFLAILRTDGILDPADRVQDLYGRFLDPDTFENPGGLLMKRFVADSPYGDEDLFIAPPDGRVFAARCRRPGKGPENPGEACIWRFRQSGADVQLRFSPALLPQWEDMALGVARLLKDWEGK
jgi:hypothetical protein